MTRRLTTVRARAEVDAIRKRSYTFGYMVKDVLSVRLEPELIKRLDAVAELLSERAGGAQISRSNALNVVAARGIELFEAEMTSKPKKPKR
jgi:hypothetical protein